MQHYDMVVQRIKDLRQSGTTIETSPELAQLVNVYSQTQMSKQLHPDQPQSNGHQPQPPPSTDGLINGAAVNGHTTIMAYRLITCRAPIPDHLQHAIHVPNTAIPDLEKLLQAPDAPSCIVDSAAKIQKGYIALPPPTETPVPVEVIKEEEHGPPIDPADLPKGPFLEEAVNSGIYPYNAFKLPFSHLKRPANIDPTMVAMRLQCLLIPSIMPVGLDMHQIINEHDRFIEACVQQRIKELKEIPATIGEGNFDSLADIILSLHKQEPANDNQQLSALSPHGKLRAMIKLKSLKVPEKQHAMCASVAEHLTQGTLLPLNRVDFRWTCNPMLRDAHMTKQAERKQCIDHERRAKHKHVKQLSVICQHGRDIIAVNCSAQDRVTKLGRAVLSFHAFTEKEEQKCIERISKEHLKVLKADDEEAYMKLIDTAKDTRITHLLQQMDAYLDSLAQAVMAQQNESGPLDMNFDQEEGPANKAMLGAQVSADAQDDKGKVDYYAVAHCISEKVMKQPGILIGGQLKATLLSKSLHIHALARLLVTLN
ncbi:uncharacterized protein BJ212DRAFT_1545885 [Suillus subaureus]|uniref:HSA domain-containing protein n=1 Tax=Suillus subaureus TaxID=48587 RepID=A0A9P7JG93_9AGAM|nr:uncharacterized protein BJ212DRAFT_1545885 [Suillus subaureus]KAG1821541.1 hypothetical protein BJ212DRAFT_1545885 [Suillus subaureus]